MKALRIALIAIVALVILLVAAVGTAMMVIDPNDYKGHIEQAAADNTNLELRLNGDIRWSFIPLGLSVADVQASLEGEEFVALDELVASVDLWSLITMAPAVHTFQLDGFRANLMMNEDGTGNWTRIMPEKPEGEAAPTDESAAETEQTLTDESGSELISFNVQQVRISNAQVNFENRQSGQSFQLSNASLEASDIALGQDFPLELGFSVSLNEPELDVDGTLAMQLNAAQNLKQFSMSGLDGDFTLTGAPFNGETVSAGLSGSASADLDAETASVSGLMASLENLEVTSNLNIQGFNAQPDVSGDLKVAEFSPATLLEQLGQPAIETRDDDVLSQAAFETTLATREGMVRLQETRLQLDETEFKGQLGYGLENQAILVDLQGNRFNLDRYLPPKAEDSEEYTAEADAGSQPAGARDSELLPLETLRGLNLDIQLGLGELIASNLTLTDLLVTITGKEGRLSLDELSARLYDGGFNMTASLDARTDNPKWQFNKQLSGVQSQPLLMDLAEMDLLSGGMNLNASGTSRGNSINALLENSNGKADFRIEEGAIENVNMTRMACQGISRVHGESLSVEDWGDSTPFNDMSGNFTINNGVLENENLTADLAGLRLEGDGVVNLIESMLDYRVGLRVVGEVHRDNACRVNERIQNVIIPVRCQGGFGDDPAGLCGFDGSRFGDVLKSMARQEVDRKKDEAEQKARERVEEEVKERVDEKTRDRIRNLFN
ncbi:AsmA family protein [Halovibrio salipaludis]|uniref:AsmA family protein n=1 Tax=Halovibrio salipaludis TaxID=2032626 RepID=A0A2A2ESJ4_9GAMM|nr:AsmA family protein [Halovibrio salipaludis]PAU76401.1 AsmA family protein [Halovibrio salipaludis]